MKIGIRTLAIISGLLILLLVSTTACLGTSPGSSIKAQIREEMWKKVAETDRYYFVRGKPAFSVIQQEFAQEYEKPMFQVPYITGGTVLISWPCGVHSMSEKQFLDAFEEEITAMMKMGVNTVDIRVTFQQDPDYTKSTFIESTYGFSDKTVCDKIPYKQMDTTFSPDTMAKLFQKIHKNNLKVLLEFSSFTPKESPQPKPWKGNVWADDLNKFFAEYLEKMMPYVKVAQQENVEIIRIATEVEVVGENRTKERNDIFREKIIPAIRSEYKGLLTYGENVQAMNQVDFWDQLDYIGVDFYKAITDRNDPTIQELESGIEKIINEDIVPIQRKYNKPVIFQELGYKSYDGDNMPGWAGTYRGLIDVQPDLPVDHKEQADEFQATFNVGKGIPWIYGYVLWSPGYDIFFGRVPIPD